MDAPLRYSLRENSSTRLMGAKQKVVFPIRDVTFSDHLRAQKSGVKICYKVIENFLNSSKMYSRIQLAASEMYRSL